MTHDDYMRELIQLRIKYYKLRQQPDLNTRDRCKAYEMEQLRVMALYDAYLAEHNLKPLHSLVLDEKYSFMCIYQPK